MNLFVIEDGVVKPTQEALVIPAVKFLRDRDKSEKKERATLEYAYVEFFCSKKKTNVYAGYIDDAVRSFKIIEGLFKKVTWKPDKAVKKVIDIYLEFQYKASPTLSFYESALVGLQKLQDYYNTIDMTLVTRGGALVNKPSDVARGLSATASLLTEFTSLREKVEQELLSNTKTKGNRTINHFEK